MKNKVLSMLVLLIAVATGAWAGNNGYLYLDLSGTTATLKCSNSPGENPFYYQGNWNENQYPGDFDEFKSNFISNCTEITVDASCQNYDGNHYIQLFYDWKALKTINNIGNLKTSSITSMYMMFSGCSSLTTLDLSDWDTSSVGDMGAMFLNCENLTTIYVGSNWSIAAVNSSDNMFLGCEKLPGYNANYDNNATYAHTGAGGYLSVKAATPTSYTVSMKEGTEDATNWTITPNPATAGTQVTATYSGTKRVKSVKAKKKAKPAATVTTAPTAKTGVKAGEDVAIVNEGTAEGGTMMYMVNATQPASTDGFSATVPTAKTLAAGTYYVWYYVKADDSHTDSEISASGIEVTIAAAETTVTWTTTEMNAEFLVYDGWAYNNSHYGITVTASGSASWEVNNIHVNGPLTFTFTSTVGNIKSIVITADGINIDEFSAPSGWTTNNMWDNPRTLSWNGTASTTVDLPLYQGQNFSGISTIVFTVVE